MWGRRGGTVSTGSDSLACPSRLLPGLFSFGVLAWMATHFSVKTESLPALHWHLRAAQGLQKSLTMQNESL